MLVAGITINSHFDNVPLKTFLNETLSSKGIDFQILNNKVILIPKSSALDLLTPTLFDFTLHGKVVDEATGETLPHALVRVAGANRGTTTNKDGYFLLSNVPSDTSTIEVSYLGYTKDLMKLKPGASRKTLQVKLKQDALQLEEVVVNSIQPATINLGETTGQLSINPKKISSIPGLGELDVFRSLQLLPGISGTDETSSALSIRGSEPSHNLVLFDGFSIYHLDHFFGVFSAINSDAVKDIQVYKGGFESKYGGRVSGVVDITGKSGNLHKPAFNIGANFLSTRFLSEIPLFENKVSLLLAGRRSYTDIIQSNLFKKLYKRARENTDQLEGVEGFGGFDQEIEPDFHFYDFNTKITYRTGKKDLFSLSIYQGKDLLDTEADRSAIEDVIIYRDVLEETARWGNKGLSLNWSRQWTPRYYSQIQFTRSSFFSNYEQHIEFEIDSLGLNDLFEYDAITNNSIDDFQFNFKNEWQIGSKHVLDFGLNHTNLTIDSEVTIEDENLSEYNEGGNITSLYFTDHFSPHENWKISAGIRYNLTNLTSDDYIAYRLGLNFRPDSHWQLKLSAGTYYQFANQVIYDDPLSNSQDFWALADDVEVPHLKSTHFIAGFGYQTADFLFDVEYYHKDIKGMLDYSISHIFDQLDEGNRPELDISEGSGKVNGIDILLQKKNGIHQGWIAYTLSKSTNQFDFINNGEKIDSRQDQRHEIKVVNMVSFKKWNLSATWLYGSGKAYYQPEIRLIRNRDGFIEDFEIRNRQKTVERLPSYHRMDIAAARKFQIGKAIGEFGISLLNVYGKNNIRNRRLDIGALERATSKGRLPQNLYRDLQLLDFTPSLFLNIAF